MMVKKNCTARSGRFRSIMVDGPVRGEVINSVRLGSGEVKVDEVRNVGSN